MPRLPPFLIPLILINLTGHMALSGGRLSGSLYVLQTGQPEVFVGLFMALFSVLPVITSLAIGRWVDRAGAARVIRIGVVLVLIGAWTPVLMLSLTTLMIMAVMIGFGFNIMSVASQHTVGNLVVKASSSERLANFGWFALGHSASATLGPFIAGFLIDHVSFKAAFACMAGSVCVSAILVFTRTKGLPVQRFAASVGVQPGTSPLSDKRDVLDLLASPEMRRIYWVNAMTATAWDLFIVMLPILGHRLGYSAAVIGTVFSLFALGTFIARAFLPSLSRKFNEWQILRAALVIICLVFFTLPWAVLAPLLMTLGLVFGCAVGTSQPSMLSLLHSAAPPGRGGEAVGLRSVLSNSCSVVVPLVFGAALATFSVPVLMVVGGIVVASGLKPAHNGVLARQFVH